MTIWEEEALTHLPLIIAGGRPPRYVTYGGIDAFNARMIAQTRSLSLSDVRRRLDETHRRLIAFIQSTPAAASSLICTAITRCMPQRSWTGKSGGHLSEGRAAQPDRRGECMTWSSNPKRCSLVRLVAQEPPFPLIYSRSEVRCVCCPGRPLWDQIARWCLHDIGACLLG